MAFELKTPFAYMDPYLDMAARTSGFQLDHLRFLFSMVASILASFVLRAVPSSPRTATLKHLISITLGLQTLWYLFQWDMMHHLISSTVCYFLVHSLPRQFGYKVAITWAAGYILLSHLYRIYIDYMGWSADFTGPQMVLTIKLTAYAFSWHDGSITSDEKLSPRERFYAIRTRPSILEYFGWVLFFPGFLAGPAVEWMDYIKYADGSMFPDNKMPSIPVYDLLVRGFGIAGLALLFTVLLGGTWGPQFIRSIVVDTAESVHHPLWYLYWIIYTGCLVARLKYYLIWELGEASCNAAGIGYNSTTEKWDKLTNVEPFTVEFGTSAKVMLDAWNMRTERWLRYYVYERAKFVPALKPVAKWVTFLASAMWHGFYPAYYLTFISAAFHGTVAQAARLKIRPRVVGLQQVHGAWVMRVYDAITWVFASVSINYCFTPFVLLSWHDGWYLWKNTFFFAHILALLFYILVQFIPSCSPVIITTTQDDSKKKHQ